MSLEDRVAALEHRVELESGLRAAVDRDLSTLAQRMSAANHLLQALAITQAEHTETLSQHTETLNQHTETLNQHTETLNQHTETLNQHTAKLDRILELIERRPPGST